MSTLEEIAFTRSSEDLPDIAGTTYADKLINGRNLAERAILKYVPGFQYDKEKAYWVNQDVQSWVSNNRNVLAQIFSDRSQDVMPDDLRIEMGVDLYREWVLAMFTEAAYGLGPWAAGTIDDLVHDQSSDLTQDWAIDDADFRLNVFRTILGMEQSGELAEALEPSEGGAGVILAAIAIVAVVAGVVYYAVDTKKAELNNSLMQDLCLDPNASEELKIECTRATSGLEKPRGILDSIEEDVGGAVIKIVLIAAAGLIAVQYGVPFVTKQIDKLGAGKKQ